MIVLSSDCLIFHTPDGESIPYTAENISIQVIGGATGDFDTEFIRHAAAAVFHYFRDELRRESVSVGEFSIALEKVLQGFSLSAKAVTPATPAPAAPVAPPANSAGTARVVHTDLQVLAGESQRGGELFFFPRLRDELRNCMRESPHLLCFRNVRGCVKQLTGLQRWSHRCQSLQDQIVEYLRSCMDTDNCGATCALLVK